MEEPRVVGNKQAPLTTQLLPAAEGTMPSGQWWQKGEAADAKATHVTTNSLRLSWCSAAHTASKQLRERGGGVAEGGRA